VTEADWTDRSYDSAPYVSGGRGGEWRTHARYAPSDFVTLLWRERVLMLVVFLVIVIVGAGYAMTLKTLYPAQSSLLVRLGPEYVYTPRVGDAARGAVPEGDAVMQSEVEILSSAQLKERVIQHIGLEKLFPGIGKGYDHAPADQQRMMMGKAILAMEKGLKVSAAPGTPVVRLTYEHPDPVMAARVLNTLLDEYLIYRRSILLDPTAPLEEQRKAFEARLAQADEAYESFLGSNNIGDFETEKTSLSQLQASLEQQKYTADSQLKERQGRLAALEAQLGGVNPEIGLYRDVDHTAQDKLQDLRMQRENLLSRYKPDAAPVRDMDAQIANLSRAIGEGGMVGDGARRVGVNPVYQTVLTDRIQLTAEIAALQQSSAALAAQVAEVTERQLRLGQLEPQYQDLARDRDVLQGNVRDFTVKEQESQAADAIARQGSDNIAIIERAVTPAQGKSLRRPVLILAVLLGAFTALCVGLLRMFLRPGIPTSSSAGRTLDLPVLAIARVKPESWV
jgi:uncharacterized protein involved in exopolysaccharide biosynthesis